MFPLKTASCLGLSIKDFVPTDQHVRAYDNSRREILGIMTLELTIGPTIKKVDFQVLNIALCFNMLLTRPWIHYTEVVPSFLYQKVQFPYEGAIVTIYSDTLTIPKPIFGINSKNKPLTLDGFEIKKPSYWYCILSAPDLSARPRKSQNIIFSLWGHENIQNDVAQNNKGQNPNKTTFFTVLHQTRASRRFLTSFNIPWSSRESEP